MGAVTVAAEVAGSPARAERLWHDTDRWPLVIDGFARIVEQDAQWPAVGSSLRWESTPHGRGEVTERVVEYEFGERQTVEVADDQLTGKQVLTFEASDRGTLITLTLEYRLRAGGPLRWALDIFFVRRALADSLRRTLAGFQREIEG